MSCKAYEPLIIRYTEGELSLKEQKVLEDHLRVCKHCFDKVQILMALAKEAEAMPSEQIDVLPRVRESLSAYDKSPGKPISRAFLGRSSRLVKPAFLFLSLAILCLFLWPLLSKGAASLFQQRFGEGSPHQTVTGSEMLPTPESKPAVTPPATVQPGFSLSFYRSTMTYEEILSLSREIGRRTPPYSSIPIDRIALEEEPFLTDSSINAFVTNTQQIKVDAETLDVLFTELMDTRPIPFVVTLSGERLFWGVFIHPLSSIAAPDLPLLTIRSEGDVQRLTLSKLDKAGASAEKAFLKFFEDRYKLAIQINSEVLPYMEALQLVNFNTPDNKMVELPLPEGWYAQGQEYELSGGFTWNREKNKNIKKLRAYTLYFDEKLEDTYYWGIKGQFSGEIHLQGFYNEYPYPGLSFNHAKPLEDPVKKQTFLGEAWVYYLECDNYPAAMAEEYPDTPPTFDMIFVVIPIEGENLAYALSLPVPEGMDIRDFYPYAEQILMLN